MCCEVIFKKSISQSLCGLTRVLRTRTDSSSSSSQSCTSAQSSSSSPSRPRTIFQRAIEASQLRWDNDNLQRILRHGDTCSCLHAPSVRTGDVVTTSASTAASTATTTTAAATAKPVSSSQPKLRHHKKCSTCRYPQWRG